MLLFVDQTAFIALNSPVSPNHSQAVDYVRSLTDQTVRVVTSRGAVVGTTDVLKQKVGGEGAVRFLRLVEEGEIKILPANSQIYKEAGRLFREHTSEQEVYFGDCINIATMQHYGVNKLFTFNEHLKKLQILTVPR